MTRQTVAVAPVVALLLLAVAGCSNPAPYADRMKFLDDMSKKGIEYRGQLHQQGTEPSDTACKTGYYLLKADPPADDYMGPTPTWLAQVEEAYVKSCMTGAPRPKPDPSGIKAVTPVPVVSPMVSPSS
jgi:hypothetical protein